MYRLESRRLCENRIRREIVAVGSYALRRSPLFRVPGGGGAPAPPPRRAPLKPPRGTPAPLLLPPTPSHGFHRRGGRGALIDPPLPVDDEATASRVLTTSSPAVAVSAFFSSSFSGRIGRGISLSSRRCIRRMKYSLHRQHQVNGDQCQLPMLYIEVERIGAKKAIPKT
uniref:Uncharacterized protein n=1 Tax=Oryza glumipatula TaxID=40148 RepID=A0A0D9YPL5_9ORYZ